MDSDPNSFALVIDTNIVLDLFVFNDEAAKPIKDMLNAGTLQWLATHPMRIELERVLAYPQVAPRLVFHGLTTAAVLARFDQHATIVPPAPKAIVTCKDPDDQLFIDLAVQRKAPIVTKDRDILSMKKRLAALQVRAARSLEEIRRE